MKMCAKDRFSNCGHAQNAMVTGTPIPAGKRDSDTQVQNLYPSQPYTHIILCIPDENFQIIDPGHNH